MNGDLALQIFVAVLTAGALYGAIRADLKNLREKIERVERDAASAHERIDALNSARIVHLEELVREKLAGR